MFPVNPIEKISEKKVDAEEICIENITGLETDVEKILKGTSEPLEKEVNEVQ